MSADSSLVKDVVTRATGSEGGEGHFARLPADMRMVVNRMPAAQRAEFIKQYEERVRKGLEEMQASGPHWVRAQIAAAMPRKTRGFRGARIKDAELGQEIGIGKAWQGVHYLLAGTSDVGPAPLAQAILGGISIGDDLGYGPARALDAEHVKEVAGALAAVDRQALGHRYDSTAMSGLALYPGNWDEPDALEWLLDSFDQVRSFYSDSAAQDQAALLWIE
jgi:hypothetical protein